MDNIVIKPVLKKRQWFLKNIIRLFKEKPLGAACGLLFVLIALTAVFANVLSPYPPNMMSLTDILQPPSSTHLLGSDNLGRDLLSRVIFGARISVTVGVLVPAISLIVAVSLGITSGFIGGNYDLILQRFIEAWMCFPPLIVLMTVMAITGQGLFQLVVIMGIFAGIGGSRTIRAAVLNIRNEMYINAAETIGLRTFNILSKHILPNISSLLIIIYTGGMAGAILGEASLSFLGLGVPPPNPTWGGMLSSEGRRYMLEAPHLSLFPGIALSVTVFSLSMMGDSLRDLLDPRLRGGLGRYRKLKANELSIKMRGLKK